MPTAVPPSGSAGPAKGPGSGLRVASSSRSTWAMADAARRRGGRGGERPGRGGERQAQCAEKRWRRRRRRWPTMRRKTRMRSSRCADVARNCTRGGAGMDGGSEREAGAAAAEMPYTEGGGHEERGRERQARARARANTRANAGARPGVTYQRAVWKKTSLTTIRAGQATGTPSSAICRMNETKANITNTNGMCPGRPPRISSEFS